MTHWSETARRPDEQRLVNVPAILAAGNLRLRESQALPVAKPGKNAGDSAAGRLELSGETVLRVVHGGQHAARSIPQTTRRDTRN